MPTPEEASPREHLNRLVADVRNCVPGAMDQLLGATHPRLLKMAELQLRNEQYWGLLEPSALVNEAFVRLRNGREWVDISHYYNTYALTFHHIIVDHARQAARMRELVGLEETPDPPWKAGSRSAEELMVLASSLRRLAEVNPRGAEIMDRFLKGFTQDEIAAALKIALRTVKREVQWCREWLRNQMVGDGVADNGHTPRT